MTDGKRLSRNSLFSMLRQLEFRESPRLDVIENELSLSEIQNRLMSPRESVDSRSDLCGLILYAIVGPFRSQPHCKTKIVIRRRRLDWLRRNTGGPWQDDSERGEVDTFAALQPAIVSSINFIIDLLLNSWSVTPEVASSSPSLPTGISIHRKVFVAFQLSPGRRFMKIVSYDEDRRDDHMSGETSVETPSDCHYAAGRFVA
jgi:hypothetical protein